jgi:hypothetical protein
MLLSDLLNNLVQTNSFAQLTALSKLLSSTEKKEQVALILKSLPNKNFASALETLSTYDFYFN